MEDPYLLQPLLAKTAAATSAVKNDQANANNIKSTIISSNSSIIRRLIFIILIATISLWANYEASKGFMITVINDAGDSLAGKRFSLFYDSNDKATRIILTTSKFVENILYTNDHHARMNSHHKKQLNHVILRLAGQNITTIYSVESRINHEYVLHLSPSIMEEENFDHAILSAVQRGMTSIWLWDGGGTVPRQIMDGIVEYISSLMGSESPEVKCSGGKVPELDDSKAVVQFLNYCEKQNKGFIRRLNQDMKDDWHVSTVNYFQLLCNKNNTTN